MTSPLSFTPTQQRMIDILQDGRPHTKTELFECLPDQCSSHKAVNLHLLKINKKLATRGQRILAVAGPWGNGSFRYQWVRLLENPYDGK